MKQTKLIIGGLFTVLLAACGSNNQSTETTEEPPQSMVEETITPPVATVDGQEVYERTCQACHQKAGEGIPKAFPPLANSDMLNANVDGAIDGVIHGRKGEITVNGEKYNSEMAALGGTLSDEEIASVLTYVYGQWNNNKTVVTADMVKARR